MELGAVGWEVVSNLDHFYNFLWDLNDFRIKSYVQKGQPEQANMKKLNCNTKYGSIF